MKRFAISAILLSLSFLFACQPAERVAKAEIEATITDVLSRQVAAWNQGNIDEYMEGYYQSDSLRFASGGTITFGWQFVRDRYHRRYGSAALMGKLTFSELDATVISNDAAILFGRWELERENDRPGGLFTLLFRNTEQGWRIVHDHTSAASN